jgi:arylsulfatase A-like enzyme
MARWPGRIPAGRVDRTTVISSLDLFPACCKLAGIEAPKAAFDGEDLSRALTGSGMSRKRPLFWDYGRDATYLRPGVESDRSPNLAIRRGKWKLMMNAAGPNTELYHPAASPREQQNGADRHKGLTRQLSDLLIAWRRSLP